MLILPDDLVIHGSILTVYPGNQQIKHLAGNILTCGGFQRLEALGQCGARREVLGARHVELEQQAREALLRAQPRLEGGHCLGLRDELAVEQHLCLCTNLLVLFVDISPQSCHVG